MLYRKILHQSWVNTWKNKYLLFFGLFAALLGNGGGLEVVFRVLNKENQQVMFSGLSKLSATGFFSMQTIFNIFNLMRTDFLNMVIFSLVFLLLLLLVGFLFWLMVMSQGALVNNAAKIEGGKSHSFEMGVKVGAEKFWPVLGLNVIYQGIVYFLLLLISLPIILSASRPSYIAASVLFILLFLILVPIAVAFSFVIKYAIAFVVIKQEKLKESLVKGWELFSKNWLVSIEMAFLLAFINLIVVLLLIFTFLVLSIPLLFVALILAKLTFVFAFWIVFISSLLFYLFILVFVGSTLSAFQITAWTSLFIQLTGKGAKSKIIRIFEKK